MKQASDVIAVTFGVPEDPAQPGRFLEPEAEPVTAEIAKYAVQAVKYTKATADQDLPGFCLAKRIDSIHSQVTGV